MCYSVSKVIEIVELVQGKMSPSGRRRTASTANNGHQTNEKNGKKNFKKSEKNEKKNNKSDETVDETSSNSEILKH